MNWELMAQAKVGELYNALIDAGPEVTYADGEEGAKPTQLKVAVDAALVVAEGLAGDSDVVLATINGHETAVPGDEFKAGHVAIVVSRVSPDAT